MENNNAGKKLIIYDMDLIHDILGIIRELKSSNIEESRKHIAIYDALDQNFVQVIDAPAQNEVEVTKDPAQQKPPIVVMEENGEDEEENWAQPDPEEN